MKNWEPTHYSVVNIHTERDVTNSWTDCIEVKLRDGVIQFVVKHEDPVQDEIRGFSLTRIHGYTITRGAPRRDV